ncbi:YHS domain-containing protein [Candidatus Bipolaricaulota bacterium]|nr:YHS domain-containing protein [Candidatus Bipolaricaulota bacterium]
MAIDPVCKMTVDEATAAATSEYQGNTYYFCAPGCKTAFDEEPQRYLEEPEAPVKKTLLQRLNPFKRE